MSDDDSQKAKLSLFLSQLQKCGGLSVDATLFSFTNTEAWSKKRKFKEDEQPAAPVAPAVAPTQTPTQTPAPAAQANAPTTASPATPAVTTAPAVQANAPTTAPPATPTNPPVAPSTTPSTTPAK